MAKCNQLTPLPFKGLIVARVHFAMRMCSSEQNLSEIPMKLRSLSVWKLMETTAWCVDGGIE